MDRRSLLSRMQIGLFLLCSVTYLIALVYFAAVLPGTLHTMVDRRGNPMCWMGKGFFLAVYTLLLAPVLLIQFSERVPSPRFLRGLCRNLNEQRPRLGTFSDPLVWRWMALPYYGLLLFVFLAVGISNYRHMAT